MSEDNNNESVNNEANQPKSNWNNKDWKNTPDIAEKPSTMPAWKKSLLMSHLHGRN